MKFDKLVNQILKESNTVSTENYYQDLDNYLSPTLTIGENKTNPDSGIVNPNQKGIYYNDKQVGKIEVTIEGNKLTLENIRRFNDAKEIQGYRIGEKVLQQIKAYALKHNLVISVEFANTGLEKIFNTVFKDWDISTEGSYTIAKKD
jgi:hypothetical protein